MTAEIYLDHAASTPLDPRVAGVMAKALGDWQLQGNPASLHASGRAAAGAIAQARAQVAALIGAEAEDIVFTSGATESINLAILGIARATRVERCRLLTSRVEHRAVLDAFRQLEREGSVVDYWRPDAEGRMTPAAVIAALRSDTALASFQHASNELGVVNDIDHIARACQAAGAWLHVDAAQSAGKLPIDVRAAGISCLSLSAHKLGGPKGAGALWISPTLRGRLQPLMFGGGQQNGLRPGTLATHQIIGFGRACHIAMIEMAAAAQRVSELRERLWLALQAAAPIWRNAASGALLPGILSVTFPGIEGESLLLALDGKVAASSGSACNSASGEPSYVLRAIGLSDLAAQATLRLSLGPDTSAEDIDRAAAEMVAAVRWLRALAPAAASERVR